MINTRLKLIFLFAFGMMVVSVAYAAQTVTDRVEIDNDDIAGAVDFNNNLGYQIEAIGDLDSDGVIDLASIMFGFDNEAGDDADTADDFGSILILFMNADGSVKSTNNIIMDATANGLTAGCIAGDGTNRDFGSIEQLAFVGDLDGDGLPTIALGANSNNHDVNADNAVVTANSGAVYMLELKTTGKVDNCVLIVPENGNGFNPADGAYIEQGTANFGWPVIATDLNGDGQNELLVGANSDPDNFTDLWVLFLNADGTVSSHPAAPISGNTIGVDTGEYIDDGASISGTKIVVSNQADGDGGGSVFIVNLTAAGAFVSSTEIAGSTIAGIANDESFGSGVASLGDMDNDGVNDIIVGNEAGDDTAATSGEAHILYLNADDTLKESQKISNESENTRTAISPFAATDLFGHGMALWRDSGDTAIIAISAHQDDTGGETNSGAIHLFSITRASSITATSAGGSDDESQSRPTFGIDYKTFVQRVDNGLIINNQTYTVTDNFYTPMDLLELKVGATQNFTATAYAPHTLYITEFLFGIPTIDKWDEAESSIEIYTNFDGEVIDFKINEYNDSPIINATSLEFASSKVKCVADDNSEPCYRVSIEFSFNESPVGKVLALQAIDYKRMNNILYFNDGLDIVGDSLNPATIQQIVSEIKYKGLQTIQRVDKEHDIWLAMDKSEPVLLYQQNSFGTFIPIEYRTFVPESDELVTIMDREHSEFYKLLDYETKRAIEQFQYITSYKQIQGDDLTKYVAEEMNVIHTSRADDKVLQQGILDAEERAKLHLLDLLSKTHYAHLVKNNSYVGILEEFTSDDRPINEILAEEREMKNTLTQDRAYLKQVIAAQK